MKTRSFNSFSPGEEDMPAYPDEQLVMEALGDSHLAFEQLVEQYQYRVLRTIASIVSDEQAAQDVAQETFLSAWSNLAKLKEKGRFGGWLNQIAINFSKRWLRDQHRYQEHTASFTDMISSTQEQRYQSDKLRQEIWDAIDELAEDYREAVILYYISGYSYKEISEMFSVPVSTIRGRLQEARNQLRKEFLDMVTKLQLEIDSTVHKFLKEHAKQNGVSIEGLIVRLIERYKRDMDRPGIAVRKLWDNTTFHGCPSPDGRYLSMVNWKTGNLAVRDLTSRKNRDITNDGHLGKPPHRWAGASTWSPDGKQIAYAWCNEGDNELRIIGLDGSEPRVLYRAEGHSLGIISCDWSQDGKFIVGWSDKVDGSSEVVLVSVADGSLRTLKSLKDNWGWSGKKRRISFSPDGRHVVYDRKPENGFCDIFLLATDGSGQEVPLVGHPDGDDSSPFWAPDGKTIVFKSFRESFGKTSLWLTRVVDGKQVGARPQLVKKEAGVILPLGFTREGSLYYGIWYPGSVDIYVASLDMETGEILSPPRLLRSDGNDHSPAWSPDGKSLAYISMRSSAEKGHFAALVIRSMETGEEREILPEIQLGFYHPYLRWSPDGRSVLYGDLPVDLRHPGLHLIDVETGDVTTVVDAHPKVRLWAPAWSPDGKTMFYIRQRTEKGEWPCSIVAHDAASGEEKELYPISHPWDPLAVSPDGRELAFGDEVGKVLKVIPSMGGQAHELVRLRNEAGKFIESIYPIMWTSDGRHLLFEKHKRSRTDKAWWPLEMWRVPTDGREPEKLWEMKESLRVADIHPDGQRIAYSKHSVGWQTELWTMENLLTTFAADK